MDCRLILTSSGTAEIFSLREGVTTLGRDTDNDIQLVSENVSRHHASINNMISACEIEDIHSSNGTFVNGQRETTCVLRHGDELRIGDQTLRFEETRPHDADYSALPHEYTDRAQAITHRTVKHPDDKRGDSSEKKTGNEPSWFLHPKPEA